MLQLATNETSRSRFSSFSQPATPRSDQVASRPTSASPPVGTPNKQMRSNSADGNIFELSEGLWEQLQSDPLFYNHQKWSGVVPWSKHVADWLRLLILSQDLPQDERAETAVKPSYYCDSGQVLRCRSILRSFRPDFQSLSASITIVDYINFFSIYIKLASCVQRINLSDLLS
jgi:hypothetical protein